MSKIVRPFVESFFAVLLGGVLMVCLCMWGGCTGKQDGAVIPPSESPPIPSGSPPPLAVVPFAEAKTKQHQQAWAKHLGEPVEKEISLPGGEKLVMVLIPAGEFVREEGGQQFRVRLTKPFYLGKYEVTQAQWQAVMGTNPSLIKDSPTNPAENVSWNDIQPFLAKLNAGGAAGRWRFELPTEAQWEYACRAGTTTAYSFGDSHDDLPQYGWFDENSSKKTHPVGRLKPNPFGLYDMHGNVFEWCVDWFDETYYAAAPLNDPRGPSQGSSRVYRGGCWSIPGVFSGAADRDGSHTADRFSSLGFRVAAVPSSPASPAEPAKE